MSAPDQPDAPSGDGGERRHVLYVCRTCPRYEAPPRPGERTRGLALVEAVKALAREWALAGRFKVLGVNCLNGCPSPCNVVLAATGGCRVRFHRLGPDDAALVLELAALYYGNGGDVPASALPEALRDKLAATVPPLDDHGRPLRADLRQERK